MRIAERLVAGFGLLAVATGLHSSGQPSFGAGLLLWFVLAVGMGWMLPRWWVVLTAPLPWLVGVGMGLLTDRYAFLADAWQAVWLVSTLVGVAGMALGLGLRRWIRTGAGVTDG